MSQHQVQRTVSGTQRARGESAISTVDAPRTQFRPSKLLTQQANLLSVSVKEDKLVSNKVTFPLGINSYNRPRCNLP